MPSNNVEQVINDAITNYIEYFFENIKKQTNAVNSALGAQTLPSKLVQFIKESLDAECEAEKEALFNGYYAEQKVANNHYLRTISLEQLKIIHAQNQLDLNELNKKIKEVTDQWMQCESNFNTGLPNEANKAKAADILKVYTSSINVFALYKLYVSKTETLSDYYRIKLSNLITSIFQAVDNVWSISKTAGPELELFLFKLENVEAVVNCKQLLSQYKSDKADLVSNLALHTEIIAVAEMPADPPFDETLLLKKYHSEFIKGVTDIENTYDFDRLTSKDIQNIFKRFVKAIRPQIKTLPEFADALEQLDYAEERKYELETKTAEIINILNNKISSLGISNVDLDKKLRINNLKQRLETHAVTSDASLDSMKQIIVSWGDDLMNNKRNLDCFRPKKNCLSVFSCTKNDAIFLRCCLETLSEDHSKNMKVACGN